MQIKLLSEDSKALLAEVRRAQADHGVRCVSLWAYEDTLSPSVAMAMEDEYQSRNFVQGNVWKSVETGRRVYPIHRVHGQEMVLVSRQPQFLWERIREVSKHAVMLDQAILDCYAEPGILPLLLSEYVHNLIEMGNAALSIVAKTVRYQAEWDRSGHQAASDLREGLAYLATANRAAQDYGKHLAPSHPSLEKKPFPIFAAPQENKVDRETLRSACSMLPGVRKQCSEILPVARPDLPVPYEAVRKLNRAIIFQIQSAPGIADLPDSTFLAGPVDLFGRPFKPHHPILDLEHFRLAYSPPRMQGPMPISTEDFRL